jgi:hypothetical protein
VTKLGQPALSAIHAAKNYRPASNMIAAAAPRQ